MFFLKLASSCCPMPPILRTPAVFRVSSCSDSDFHVHLPHAYSISAMAAETGEEKGESSKNQHVNMLSIFPRKPFYRNAFALQTCPLSSPFKVWKHINADKPRVTAFLEAMADRVDKSLALSGLPLVPFRSKIIWSEFISPEISKMSTHNHKKVSW